MSRINLWSGPRNISTALMYGFAQRKDMTVVDEPLYAHYLRRTDTEAEHPGTAEVLAAQENDGEQVVQQMLTHNYGTENVLFKQMTHHLIELNEDFLLKMKNVLLIRDPRRIIASYAKVIDNAAIHDVGIKKQAELFDVLREKGKLHAVLDTEEVLRNPRRVLAKLCEKLDLPFDENMLEWQAGARPEDGVWAKYWYENVHRSTGFLPYEKKEVMLSPQLEKLAAECVPYYEKLKAHAIKSV